jgi:hypothetical protein
LDHIIAAVTLDTIVTFDNIVAFLIPWLPCWRHRQWCGVKNVFGILVQLHQRVGLRLSNLVNLSVFFVKYEGSSHEINCLITDCTVCTPPSHWLFHKYHTDKLFK